jgi:hypothetical protein
MRKIIFALLLMPCANAVYADPVVLRARANEYALVGEGTVATKDCTVTAEGTLNAKITKRGSKRWLLFIDRNGEEEAQCEIRYTVSRPHRTQRTMVAVRR